LARTTRLRLIVKNMVWVAGEPVVLLELLEARAVCEGNRPAHVRQAGVVTENGVHFHPALIVLPGSPKPCQPMLHDGESVTFYFDVLSFADDGYLPKRVWVQDFADHRYMKRLRRKDRKALRARIARLRERVGDELDSQGELLK
jgi:hypothetical protein